MDALESIRDMYEEVDSDEEIKPSKRFKSSEAINSDHNESIASFSATIEPSQPFPIDSEGPPPPMDAMESRRATEQINPPKKFKSSESMNLGHHRSTSSSSLPMEDSEPSTVDSMGLSPPMDAIETIREMYDKINTVGQIDQLVSFVETQLQRMNIPSGAGSSSSEGWLETVGDGTKLAAKTIDTISTEAEKLSKSDAVEAMGGLTLKVVKGVGEWNWVFLGLSVAAFAVDRYISVGFPEKECSELKNKVAF